MRFTKVENYELRPKTKLDIELNEFMNLETKIAICNFEEGRYKTIYSAYSTWYKAIKHWGYPIQINMRQGKIYLTRTDM